MHDRLKPLISLPFIICLVLLLLNDFLLKAAFHNVLTGKLSDVCGLFVFAIFWSVVFPRFKLSVCILTGILFIYWKSIYATPFIDFFSTYVFSIGRVADLTDLFALPVLGLAWLNLKGDWGTLSIKSLRLGLTPYLIALVTLFSFCATSQRQYIQTFENPQYVLLKASPTADSVNRDDDMEYYNLDSMLVVGIRQLYTNERPVKYDDYQKNKMIRDLDTAVASMAQPNKGLMPRGKVTTLTIRTPQGDDFLRFQGSRLDGKFVRKHGGKVVIEGFYKMGIEDSVWTLKASDSKSVTKQIFVNGERTKVEQFENGQLVSSAQINTRAVSKRNKMVQIVFLSLLFVGTIVLIIRNYRSSAQFVITGWWKLALCFTLPLAVWLLQLGITFVLGDYDLDIFALFGMAVVIFLITCPLFGVILFAIKLRRPIDVLWYCLLLALGFCIWTEYTVFVALAV
jgi:hypothetical protein